MDPRYRPVTLFSCLLLISSHAFAQSSNNEKKKEECRFPAIFNFGDSNSDTGALSAAFGRTVSPHGETFFDEPAGRFCDGRLIVDFIAESFGLPHLSAYLDSIGANFSHGANFAMAGSTIRNPNSTITQSGISPVSVQFQFTEFRDFQVRSPLIRKKGGVFKDLLPEDSFFSQALYTIDAGQNDVTAGYKFNLTTEEVKALVPDIVSELSDIIKKIYGQGGRSFWVHNTGPLGCLPFSLTRFLITGAQIDDYGCATPLNEASQFYNQKLKEAMSQLRKDLPLAAITYIDVYSLKRSLFTNAKSLGFVKPLEACCGTGDNRYNFDSNRRCGFKEIVNGKEVLVAKSCENPETRVLWDGIHYTEAANKWIFNQIASGAYSDPPVPLKFACRR